MKILSDATKTSYVSDTAAVLLEAVNSLSKKDTILLHIGTKAYELTTAELKAILRKAI